MRSSPPWRLAAFLVTLLGCAGSSSPARTTGATATGVAATTATEATATARATVVAPAGSATGTADDPAAQGAATGGGSCDITNHAAWASCEGQVVTITGEYPQHIHQHPMMVGPPALSGGRTQAYMDVPRGSQIILIVNKPVQCGGAMAATGTLRGINKNGVPGTKESYGGWYLDDASVKCL